MVWCNTAQRFQTRFWGQNELKIERWDPAHPKTTVKHSICGLVVSSSLNSISSPLLWKWDVSVCLSVYLSVLLKQLASHHSFPSIKFDYFFLLISCLYILMFCLQWHVKVIIIFFFMFYLLHYGSTICTVMVWDGNTIVLWYILWYCMITIVIYLVI